MTGLTEMTKAAQGRDAVPDRRAGQDRVPVGQGVANELVAAACMARAARHFDAATVLTYYGF